MIRDSLQVVQISDLHLFAQPDHKLLGVVTAESFQAVLTAVLAENPLPDLILLTGDLSQDGSAASYARLKDSLEPVAIDTYWLAGNHDRLPSMEQKLQGKHLHLDKLIVRDPWAFILLNSLVPGKDSGYLSDKTLLELRQHLEHTASLGSHTVIGLHHPPFPVDSEWLDSSTLQQPQRLFQVLDEFSHVKLVLFGHIHQDFYHCRQGVTYLGCPSTCIQFQPKSRYFSLEVIPPAYRRFWFHPDGTFRTELMRVPQGLQHPNLHIGGY